jgi:hypothetical protein
MRIRIPYSKSRRYLTGIDWIVGALDHMTASRTGLGNSFQIVVELDALLDEQSLRTALRELVAQLPVLNGYPKRDLNLAPYWCIPSGSSGPPLRLDVRRMDESVTDGVLMSILAEGSNMGFVGRREHLFFRLITVGRLKSYFTMTFDHLLFDAFGAETFLRLLQRKMAGEDITQAIGQIVLTEPAHLDDWRTKFDAGKTFNRRLAALTESRHLYALQLPAELKGVPFRYRVVAFDERQSAAIVDRADREAGFMLLMPYLLAVSVQVLHAVRRKGAVLPPDYMVSVSTDLRDPRRECETVFFNHLSLLFFGLPVAFGDDRPALINSLKRQTYEQVKAGIQESIMAASNLMRILPLRMLAPLMLLPFHGNMSSFGFSILKSRLHSMDIGGARVTNLLHLPRIPVPPGLGFIVNQFNGRINFVLAYVEGLLSDAQADSMAADLERRLLEP